MDLRGKVVLVTGGSGGIGGSTVLRFAMEGANVAINYLRNKERALKLERQIEEIGVEGLTVKCDVSNPLETEKMIETVIKKLNGLNILVNNAGLIYRKAALEETYKEWMKTIEVNLNGVRNCSIPAAKHMVENGGGRIVNVSSWYAVAGSPSSAAYAAAKAGVIGFTKSLAKQLVSRNVLVNCVAPGPVDTEMVRCGRTKDELNLYKRQMPLKRFAYPSEIAETIVFLAKHDYITGEVIEVFGGLYM